MYDGTQNLGRRIGPLALVAALVVALVPSSALAVPRKAGESQPDYLIVKMDEVPIRSTSSDFSFVKRIDKSSPNLMRWGAPGKHFSKAVLT
jgi:hypothetical protein